LVTVSVMKNLFVRIRSNLVEAVPTLLLTMLFSVSVSANPVSEKITEVEKTLGATVGVSVYNPSTQDLWHYQGDTRFPLMSTFKTLACAKLLHDVDNGQQSFDRSVEISQEALITWSPITEKRVGERFSLKQACSAAMIMSDNTAANIVLKGINGPDALTLFMRSIGDEVTRLDRIEPFLNEAKPGDARDSTTPNAMVKSLAELLYGGALSVTDRQQLKQWMMGNKVSDSLLCSVLPKGWSIADRSGAGGFGSRAITAAVWSEGRSPLLIAIYLTQTDASFKDRNQAIAEIGAAIFNQYE